MASFAVACLTCCTVTGKQSICAMLNRVVSMSSRVPLALLATERRESLSAFACFCVGLTVFHIGNLLGVCNRAAAVNGMPLVGPSNTTKAL